MPASTPNGSDPFPDPSSRRDGADGAATGAPPLRVAFVQMIVARYRVPIFDALARVPGIDLTVLADTAQADGSLESVPHLGRFRCEHAPWTRVGGFISQPGLLEAARSGRFDVLITTWNTRLLQLFPALAAARRRSVATLLFGHGDSKNEGSLRRRIRNAALRRSDGAIVYNFAAAERLAAEGFPRTKLFTAPNAIDQEPIQAARGHWLAQPAALAAFRREHGIHGRELAIFLSRIEPDKGVDLLLRAFARLRASRPSARLAIVGDGSRREAMQALAADLGLADAVAFPGALYDDMDLAPWMLSAAAFAYPRAIGLSILHAFGYGLPVVTCDDMPSHNPEIEALRPGENGLLYRAGDIDDFAAAIGRCMDDGAVWQAMSVAALATVTGHGSYSVARMVESIAHAARCAAAMYTREASRIDRSTAASPHPRSGETDP
ncbi:MAG: glycosyltransferase [Phycisphaerales bacterium]